MAAANDPMIQSFNDSISPAIAVLAGGEGSRMGRPKGELRARGLPLLEYLGRRLAWPGPTLLVTAPGREHPPGADKFDREVTDPVPGAGPLRGILTALEHAATPLLVVAALDMPGVARSHLEWLAQQLRAAPEIIGLFLRRSGGGLLEPLPCAFRVAAALSPVRAVLDAGRRSIRSLLDVPAFDAVDVPAEWGDEVWTNLNDPAAWESFARNAPEA
jgi:molybdopterin-guanine dinucleotide biosynthesis protein A